MRLKVKTALLCLSGFLYGCGIYSFSGSTLPAHIKTVEIPLFEDQTAEYGINQKLTDALIDAVTQDNTLKIASSRYGDSALRGTILRVDDRVGQYDQNEQAGDYRITITVKVVFEDVRKKTVFWENQFSQWGRYDPRNRDAGIDEAVEKIALEIINKMVSNW